MEKYISTATAAKLAGVTQQTIQNLCRDGYLSYKKKGFMYQVSKSGVLAYKAEIDKIYSAEKDFYEIRKEYERKTVELKRKIVRTDAQFELLGIKRQFPIIMRSIAKILQRYDIYLDDILVPREKEILLKLLNGASISTLSDEFMLSKQRIHELIDRSAYKISIHENEIAILQHEIAGLKSVIEKKNDEIIKLNRIINGEIVDGVEITETTKQMSKLLDTNVRDLDTSIRLQNCLIYGGECKTLRDVVKMDRNYFLKFRNFGKKSLTELDEILQSYGIWYGMDLSLYPQLNNN